MRQALRGNLVREVVKELEMVIVRMACYVSFCLVMLVPTLVFGGVVTSVEHSIRDSIAHKGYRLGFDRDRNTFVFVGRKMADMESPENEKSFLLQREKILKIAELKAKSALLGYLRRTMTGVEYVGVCEKNPKIEKKMQSVAVAFADNLISGWQVLDVAEGYSDGVYDVAVAILWSPTLEYAGRMARAGRMVASEDYRTEFRSWLKSQNMSGWYGCRVFVDSAGFPHLLGVGVGDADGKSSIEMKALRLKCDLLARKNLMLGLWGDGEMRKAAEDIIITENDDGDRFDAESFFEQMASVEAKGKTIEGMMLVDERMVVHPLSRRRMMVVVYGVEPSMEVVVDGISTETPKSTCESQHPSSSGVQVWNPNTGKFEKR